MSDVTPDSSGAPPRTGFLSKKVGGVPVKWLILIFIVAAGGYYVYTKYFKKTAVTTTPVTTTAASTSSAPNYSGGYDASQGGQVGQDTVLPPTSGVIITTNSDWETAAINALQGTGAYSATDITNALNAALTGGSLTPAQDAIYNQAVALLGSPPQNVSTLQVAPATPVVPVPVGYFRYPTGLIVERFADGTESGLTAAQYMALGSPKTTQL